MPTALPQAPHLKHLKKQAKDLLKAHRSGDVQARKSLRDCLPRFSDKTDAEILSVGVTLHDAQHVIALQYGFANWSALSTAVDERNGAHEPVATKQSFSALKDLGEKMRQHIERLGFATAGAYRIWCHKAGLGSGLNKSDAELYEELVRHQQERPGPVLRRDYRPAEARNITKAYESENDELWDGWKKPFKGIEDAGEREALYQLMIHCAKYAPIGGPLVRQLARYYRDWLHPVEEWIPKSKNEQGLLVELTRFLLGRDEVPLAARDAGLEQSEAPSVCYARILSKRETVLSPEEVQSFEELGYVQIKEAFPRAAALEMQDFMWAELERMHGFKRDEPSTWQKKGWSPDEYPRDWTELKLKKTKDHPVYKGIAAARMVAAIEEVMSAYLAPLQQSWGAVRPIFPSRENTPWDLGRSWHCYCNPQVQWSIGMGTFYSDVKKQGGGRLFVAGSHRLVHAFYTALKPSERLRKGQILNERFLKKYPYFAELMGRAPDKGDRVRRFMEETTEVDGVGLRVVELEGEPGDAVFYNRMLVSGVARNMTDVPVFVRG